MSRFPLRPAPPRPGSFVQTITMPPLVASPTADPGECPECPPTDIPCYAAVYWDDAGSPYDSIAESASISATIPAGFVCPNGETALDLTGLDWEFDVTVRESTFIDTPTISNGGDGSFGLVFTGAGGLGFVFVLVTAYPAGSDVPLLGPALLVLQVVADA